MTSQTLYEVSLNKFITAHSQ